jgi:hypothetical protein
MQRFLTKLVQKGVQKVLETQDVQKEGLADTVKAAADLVAARAAQSFQSEMARLRKLPPEERKAEMLALREEWGLQEAMDWLQATGAVSKRDPGAS